jgi:hypothetical protein
MPVCPACHADLPETFRDGAEPLTQCPFCGVGLHVVEHEEPPLEAPGMVEPAAATLPPLPPQSSIEVIEDAPDRLVIHLPPGGAGAKGLGCFALFWNGFMCLFTPPWFLAGNQGAPLLFLVPFLTLFWAIGLGLAYFWLRMKYTRTYLLVEPERIVIQTQWLGRRKMDEAALTKTSRARLVESYSVNDVPVHAIHVVGEGRTIKFGTYLSEPEKQWVCDAIHRFLGPTEEPPSGAIPRFCWSCGAALDAAAMARTGRSGGNVCPHCGETLPAEAVAPLAAPLPIPEVTPAEIPPESGIHILRDDVERLEFWLPLVPAGKISRAVVLIAGLVGLIWTGATVASLVQEALRGPGQAGGGFWVFEMLFQLLFVIPGLGLMGVACAVRFARITVRIAPDWLTVRYHWGPFGGGRKLPTSAIDAVRLVPNSELGERKPNRPSSLLPAPDELLIATVHSGQAFLPLTTFHGRETAQAVAGLVQTRLKSLGVRCSP